MRRRVEPPGPDEVLLFFNHAFRFDNRFFYLMPLDNRKNDLTMLTTPGGPGAEVPEHLQFLLDLELARDAKLSEKRTYHRVLRAMVEMHKRSAIQAIDRDDFHGAQHEIWRASSARDEIKSADKFRLMIFTSKGLKAVEAKQLSAEDKRQLFRVLSIRRGEIHAAPASPEIQ